VVAGFGKGGVQAADLVWYKLRGGMGRGRRGRKVSDFNPDDFGGGGS
jgi:hypothetical protein